MNKFAHTVISALIGGVVGASVVFFMPSKSDKAKFDQLEVRDLIITEQAALYSADKKSESEKKSDDASKNEKNEKRPDILLKNGSMLVTNVIVGSRLIGNQVQGGVFIGNRMFTSPDNVINNQNPHWRFYTEIGSSIEKGGEIIVRSSTGGLLVDRNNTPAPTAGWALRAGYMEGDRPDISFYSNLTKEVMPVAILKKVITPDASADKTASNAAAPTSSPATGNKPIANSITTTSGGNITTPTPNNPLSPVNPLDKSATLKTDFTGSPNNATLPNANSVINQQPIVPTNPNVAGANAAENNKPR